MIVITPQIHLSDDDVQFSAVKASGPGGQHVNATHSAVQLRFDAANCAAIKPSVFQRLKLLSGSRMSSDGIIVLQVASERSQHRNRAIAIDRLVDLIKQASKAPKHRRPTRPTKGSVTRRLDTKSKRASLKQTRGRVASEG